MQQFFSYFIFSIYEIIGLIFLGLLLIIQLFFYFKYYRKPLQYVELGEVSENTSLSTANTPKVSIIIEAENEVDCLAQNLPFILEQDYPDFEVIVVNNGSTDETYELLESLKLKYSNIYDTYVPMSYDQTFGRRKLAYTLGAKAAKGEVLLFTEPYSAPVSTKWISEMVKNMSDKIDVVLGYSYYTQSRSFYNRVARFDNHFFSMQYLSMALADKPFTGVYRNVAFKKQLFFDNKGFSSHLNLENGEDVFINKIATSDNTLVALSEDSFVATTLDSLSLWRKIKRSYSIARAFFKPKVLSTLFSVEYATRYLFYALVLAGIVDSCLFQHWGLLGITSLVFLIRFITQMLIINASTRYFHSGKFYFSLILMDLLQPLYNLRFKARHKMVRGKG